MAGDGGNSGQEWDTGGGRKEKKRERGREGERKRIKFRVEFPEYIACWDFCKKF